MRKPSIAITGAGPGGLTLARILRLNGLHATIFERDASSSIRPQGWSLDMHPESGQLAIERAGLSTEFKRIARYGDQGMRVYDKHGTLHFGSDRSDGDRPEVDRSHLRQMLLDSLPEDAVRWGHELRAVEAQDDGTFMLIFKNGTREEFDLVVGADGAWSRVRPLVSNVQPVYSGVTFVTFGISDVDERHPELARLAGHGLTFALGDSKALTTHRNANAHLGVYAGLRVPEDWAENGGLDTSSNQALRASLAACFPGWSDSLLAFIHNCDDEVAIRPIHALPVGHRWEHRRGVTLIGDAAHLMSPFTGEGANLAMLDAADLAAALVSGKTGEGDWQTAVRSFEASMFARAEGPATEAREGLNETFSEDALAHTVQWMQWAQG